MSQAPGPDFYNAPSIEPTMMNPTGDPGHTKLVAEAAQHLEAAKERFMQGAPPVPTFQASTRTVLLEFPGRIRRARRELWECKAQVERLQLEHRLLEAKHGLDVAAEKLAETGKARYSNAEARENEVRQRMSEDEGARSLRKQLDETRARIDAIEGAIECWARMFKAADTIEKVDAVTSRTAVFFDLGGEDFQ